MTANHAAACLALDVAAPGKPGAGSDKRQRRERRLELVADAVKAHPARRVWTQHRVRGERRAEHDIDRMCANGQPAEGRERQAHREQQARKERKRQRTEEHEQPGAPLAEIKRDREQHEARC